MLDTTLAKWQDTRMTRKRKSKSKRWPIRFTCGVRLDIVKAAGSVVSMLSDWWRSTGKTELMQWHDVPVGALVTASSRGVDWLLLRSTVDSGALVGTIEASKASCQDDFEHQSWAALARRNGAPLVRVLARRVRPSATAAKLEALAERAFAKIGRDDA